jgi:Zinc-finger of C2H2 type
MARTIELTNENKTKLRYICEKCNIGTNSIYAYNRHLESIKHKGNREQRCDKKRLDKCPHCEYIPKSNLGLKSHIMSQHGTPEDRKKGFKFYCDICDVGVFAKAYWKMHLESNKHILNANKPEEEKNKENTKDTDDKKINEVNKIDTKTINKKKSKNDEQKEKLKLEIIDEIKAEIKEKLKLELREEIKKELELNNKNEPKVISQKVTKVKK